MSLQTGELWYPGGGATGMPFARCRIEPAGSVLVHSAPEKVSVEVRDAAGQRLAFGETLKRTTAYFPMTRLQRQDASVVRTDGWPVDDDLGSVVLLPGGEAGVLTAWWNAEDGSEWRWSLEFYNHR